jgi:hypothetical protein
MTAALRLLNCPDSDKHTSETTVASMLEGLMVEHADNEIIRSIAMELLTRLEAIEVQVPE